ncbi:MAG TPA: response regulator [Verrucomicrobiae bacterium]|nr:response regulator [Verrucomicrobiae bacterium]
MRGDAHIPRLLHLEDNACDAALARELLERDGPRCEITVAVNRRQFELALNEEGWDLVISDFNLADFDGKSAIELVTKAHPDVPVIIVSGAISPAEAVECLKAGATDYVLKDRLERLPSAVHRALDAADQRRESRRAHERLRESEERFRLMIESVNDYAIIMLSPKGDIISWNGGAARIFGYQAGEIVGRHFSCFYSEEDRGVGKPERELADAAAQGRFEEEGWRIRKDGSKYLAHVILSAVRTGSGELRGFAKVTCDITERKRTEAQMFRAQRLESIGTLASGVAHDLNNALAPILMSVEMLRLHPPEPARMLDIIESSAKRGADMVRQLLTFARGVEGERILIQPRRIIREMEAIIKGTFPKNIQLKSEIAGGLSMILGDATQLHQVLLNLCVNARDAMPGGGTLTLVAENREIDQTYARVSQDAKPGKYVVWRVKDTGTGISAEVQERIFEPFFSTKSPDKGTGLGLSTVAGIVKSHGGFVRLHSEPGQGAVFSVFLPASDSSAHDPTPLAKSGTQFRGNGETILVVDDEPHVREVVRKALALLNFKVVTAVDGTDALVKVADKRQELHLVITDCHMPNMDGVNFVRVLKHMAPAAKTVVTSGRFGEQEVAEFKSIGVSALLEKPFGQDSLIDVLKSVFTS